MFQDMGLTENTAVPTSVLKSMTRTQRAIFCAATASLTRMSIWFGWRSHCTQRPAFLDVQAGQFLPRDPRIGMACVTEALWGPEAGAPIYANSL